MITEFFGENIFLSNFAKWPCKYEGIWYPTTEHAYQAAKTLDIEERKRIAVLPEPKDAKHAGKRVKCRSDWEEIKYDVMHAVILDKFTRNIGVAKKLLATEDEKLIEGNTWHDNTWGDCSCDRCKDKPGKNWLGLILMDVRKRLQAIQDCAL